MKKIVIAVVIVVAVVLVVGFVPLVDVPYQATETYYETEPYTVSEPYTEVQQQTTTQQKNTVLMEYAFIPDWGERIFQTYININGKSNCLVKGQFSSEPGSPDVNFYVYDDTEPRWGIGTPENPIVAIGSVSTYMFSFVPVRSGIYYFRFECWVSVVRTAFELNVGMEWQETVVQSVEVTKYRDVTKYRQVQKQRTVTRYRKGTIFEYLGSRF